MVSALTNGRAREGYLKALCAFAEGAAVVVPPCSAAAALCVIALFADAQRRVARLGGREGMPRSIGSLYGGLVALFLGSAFRGRVTRTFDMPHVGGLAITPDASALLVFHYDFYDDPAYVCRPDTGERLRKISCGRNGGPLQFNSPSQVAIAPDNFVYVADLGNNRIQVLTPCFDFHSFIGVGQLHSPVGVCASQEIVAVSEPLENRISVFRRADGALLRRFGARGKSDGKLRAPQELCFLSNCSQIAVADCHNHRVSVFTTEGAFVGHLGVGMLHHPTSVACSAFGEVVISDRNGSLVKLVVSDGCLTIASVTYHPPGLRWLSGLAIHGNTIFAHTLKECVVFT